MEKLTNDEKIKRVSTRKILKVFIILFAILTIIFACLSLWRDVNPVFAIVFFLVEFLLNRYRLSLDPKKE